MDKEQMEKLLNDFNKQLEAKKELETEYKQYLEAVSESENNPAIITYLLLKKCLQKVQEQMDLTHEDLVEYAHSNTYGNQEEKGYMWMYDFYYHPTEKFINRPKITKVARDDNEGMYRVYRGFESQKNIEVVKKEAENFENNNHVVVLENVNIVTEKQFESAREEYFTKILKNGRTK